MRKSLLLPLLALAGCDQITAATGTYSCADLIPDIIEIGETNGVAIVKIYNPTKVGGSDSDPICKGEAMLSAGGDREQIYFKTYTDEDGDRIAEYQPDPYAGVEAN